MNYDSLRSMLDAVTTTTDGVPDLSYENTLTQRPPSIPWSRTTLLPVESQALTIGPNGQDRLQGLYQIDLFYPVNLGTRDANAVADALLTRFHRGSILTTADSVNLHVDKSWQAVAYTVSSWYVVPVMVRWSSYT